MAKQFLDDPKVSPALQQVSCKAMPERMDMQEWKISLKCIHFQSLAYSLTCQSCSPPAKEYKRVLFPSGQQGTGFSEIQIHIFLGYFTYRYRPHLPAFAYYGNGVLLIIRQSQ
jgi:hypothetical protein